MIYPSCFWWLEYGFWSKICLQHLDERFAIATQWSCLVSGVYGGLCLPLVGCYRTEAWFVHDQFLRLWVCLILAVRSYSNARNWNSYRFQIVHCSYQFCNQLWTCHCMDHDQDSELCQCTAQTYSIGIFFSSMGNIHLVLRMGNRGYSVLTMQLSYRIMEWNWIRFPWSLMWYRRFFLYLHR